MCSWHTFHDVVLDDVAIFLYLLVFETYEHLIQLGFCLLDGLEEGVDQLLVGLWLLLLYFNSIKVRLEHPCPDFENGKQKFQFHKGTIRTHAPSQ